MPNLLDFKVRWLGKCIEDAQAQGSSDEDILIALLEQTNSFLAKVLVKLTESKKGDKNEGNLRNT